MINKDRKFPLVLASIFSLLLFQVSCSFFESSGDAANGINDITSYPSITPGITRESTPAPISVASKTPFTVGIKTAFPVPTMTIIQQQLLRQRLHDKTCILPCYLGVVPGETSINEARLMLQELGAGLSPASPYEHQSNIKEYTYYFDIVDNGILVQQTIYLFVHEDKIIKLRVDLEHRTFQIFFEYWPRYSLSEVIGTLGFPEHAYIYVQDYDFFPGCTVKLIYEEQGIYFYYSGQKQDGLVCPDFKEDYTTAVRIHLLDPHSFDLLLSIGEASAYITNLDRTMQAAIGISDRQFYDQVISGQQICFEPIEEE